MFERETLQKVRAIMDWLSHGKVTDRCPSLTARDWLNIEQAMEDWHRMEWLQRQTKKVVLAVDEVNPPPVFDSEKPVQSFLNELAKPEQQQLATVEHVGNEWTIRSKHLHLRAAIDAQAGKVSRSVL